MLFYACIFSLAHSLVDLYYFFLAYVSARETSARAQCDSGARYHIATSMCMCARVKSIFFPLFVFGVYALSTLVFFLYHVSYVSPVIIRFSVFQELYIVHITVCTECTKKIFSVCIYIYSPKLSFRFFTVFKILFIIYFILFNSLEKVERSFSVVCITVR